MAVEEAYTPQDAELALEHLSQAVEAASTKFLEQHKQWSLPAAESLSGLLQAKVKASRPIMIGVPPKIKPHLAHSWCVEVQARHSAETAKSPGIVWVWGVSQSVHMSNHI